MKKYTFGWAAGACTRFRAGMGRKKETPEGRWGPRARRPSPNRLLWARLCVAGLGAVGLVPARFGLFARAMDELRAVPFPFSGQPTLHYPV